MAYSVAHDFFAGLLKLMPCFWDGIGEMSDAAELLMAIYEHLTPVAARTAEPHLIDTIFGLHIQVAPAQHRHTCVGCPQMKLSCWPAGLTMNVPHSVGGTNVARQLDMKTQPAVCS